MSPFTSETARKAVKKAWHNWRAKPELLKRRSKRKYDSSYSKTFPHIKKQFPITPDLAYILGTLWGDASAQKTPRRIGGFRYYISLCVKSKEFVTKFRKAVIKTINPNTHLCILKRVHGTYYQMGTDSKPFIEWYKPKNLQEIFRLIIDAGEVCNIQFIKGFFDSEGTAYFKAKDKGTRGEIKMYNANKEKLTFIQQILARLGIRAKLRVHRKSDLKKGWKASYTLRIYDGLSQCRFAEKVNSNIPNKKQKLADILTHYTNQIKRGNSTQCICRH